MCHSVFRGAAGAGAATSGGIFVVGFHVCFVQACVGLELGRLLFRLVVGVFNGVYWPLIELIPIVGQLASLVVRIILGINGNRWAWENKVWTNAEHFNRVQHQWAIAALIFFLIGVLGVIFFFSTLVAMLSSLT